jgi:hypothetical protein
MDKGLIAALEHEKQVYLKQGLKAEAAEVDKQLAWARGETAAAPARKTRKTPGVETAVDR